MDLDSIDYPHISYFDATDSRLMYARWTGIEWNITDVDVIDSPSPGFWEASIAIDSNDNPHIGYHDPTKGVLKHAVWNESTWTIQIVDSGRYIGACNSMALDSRDYPHFSYCDLYNGSLKYAKWTGASWKIQTLDITNWPEYWVWVNGWTSIALDSNDFPHISYFVDDPDYDLKYAKWTGTKWIIDTVDSEGSVGGLSSIIIDSNDRPHIAYSGNWNLKYAKWTGTRWNIESVISGGSDPSLRLDRNNTPHIAFVDTSSESLHYAEWNGNSWNFELVDSPDRGCYHVSLGLNSTGNPHISYYQAWPVSDLKHATKASSPPPSRFLSLGIDPDTLNLKSKGNWITAYLSTENSTAYDIDASSLRLNDFLDPIWWEVQNNDTLMVKFDRESVQAILSVSDLVRLKVSGQWKDGETFEVHDYIRVIDPER
jgi:hypothetical protein